MRSKDFPPLDNLWWRAQLIEGNVIGWKVEAGKMVECTLKEAPPKEIVGECPDSE